MLLQRCPLEAGSQLRPDQLYDVVRDFWAAVASVWPVAWSQPRTHLLTKGVGVTALSMLGGDVVTSLLSRQQPINQHTFAAFLAPLSATLIGQLVPRSKASVEGTVRTSLIKCSAGNYLRRAWRWLEPACRESHQCDLVV